MSSGTTKRERTDLRWGLSTGTYLTALCCAAYLNFKNGWKKKEITLIFPDKKYRSVPVLSVKNGYAKAVKDGGDDPDITNGIIMSVSLVEERKNLDTKDYVHTYQKGTYSLHGKEGLGLCTRNGLPCEKEKWAINPVPRQMILENLIHLGFGKSDENIKFDITVENGAVIAEKTLNPRLGIIGGISILGTTGLVRPYSHKAYIDTIRMLINAAVKNGLTEVLFSTGTRTARTARKEYSHLLEDQVILIGDYIQDAIQSAEAKGIKKVYISCMPGKLNKYASGYANTHAHRNDQDLGHLRRIISSLYPNETPISKHCPSVREALHNFSEREQYTVLNKLKKIALVELQKHAPKLEIIILLCDFDGGVINE